MARPPDEERPAYYRKVSATFRPRFTLSMLYLFGFFFLWCLILVAPALLHVLASMPPGPEQQAAAEAAAREAIQPRLWVAVVLAAISTVAGAHYGVLPGMRERS